MARIFVSYSRKSKRKVEELVDDLSRLGHDVMFDKHLTGGREWWEQILGFVRGSDLVVAAMDDHVLKSAAVRRELAYASDLGIPILPVIVQGGTETGEWPNHLRARQFIDYRGEQKTGALDLARALNPMPARGPLPDPLPVPPESPIVDLDPIRTALGAVETLSFDAQVSLFNDLKNHLNDPDTGKAALGLLEKLAARRETSGMIRDDIKATIAQHRHERRMDGTGTGAGTGTGIGTEAEAPDGKPMTRGKLAGYGALVTGGLGLLTGDGAVMIVMALFGAGIGCGIALFVVPKSQASG